jgi:hypothetical protein
MKTHSILIILLISFSSAVQACEICGCGNSNFQIGLLPNFKKGFVGFRYSGSRFNSQVRSDPTQFSHDYYKTMEVWGGFTVKRFQFMAFMPYVLSKKQSDDGTTVSNGVGDLLLLVNHKVLTSVKLSADESRTIVHELYFGGGLKLPTGTSHVDTANPDFNIGDFNSQAGTGSVDFLINTTYNLMWNKSGVITNAAYRINTANHKDYRFGNRSYFAAAYYYTITKANVKIKPNIGLNFQSNNINTFQGTDVDGSNGYSLSSTIGVNLIRNDFGVNAMAFVPVVQNMYEGQTTLRSRIMLGVTYSF